MAGGLSRQTTSADVPTVAIRDDATHADRWAKSNGTGKRILRLFVLLPKVVVSIYHTFC